MMLGEHSHSQSVVDEAVTILNIKLATKSFDKSRFTTSIGSDQRNSSGQINVDVHIFDDWNSFFVANGSFIEDTKWRGDFLRIREHEHDIRILHDLCSNVNPSDRLDSRLDKSGALSIAAELVNELLNMADFFHLTFTRLFGHFVLLSLRPLKCIEVSFVIIELAPLEMDDLIDGGIQKVTSVRHDNDGNV